MLMMVIVGADYQILVTLLLIRNKAYSDRNEKDDNDNDNDNEGLERDISSERAQLCRSRL